jgi:PKD repeat protein
MHKLAAAIMSLGLLAVAVPFMGTAQSSAEPVRFGMDAASVSAQTAAGVKPDYGTFWVGPWTLTSGWGGPDGQMDAMVRSGVTPAIHFYYWGDDISINCVENGCWSSLHRTQKTPEQWQVLAEQLVAHLHARMGGREVLVFMESEFNKGNVANYEPLDGYLAEKTRFIKQGYPNAKVVMSLGNWNSGAWGVWDRTAAASDYTGIQAMRGSTRDSVSYYEGVYDTVLSGARTLESKFGKPVIIQDVALSSHPEPEYLKRQADTLQDFFTGLPALKDAGVEAIIYRSWGNAPNMDLANYYGEAERHWGLAYAPSQGSGYKPAAKVWIDGVKAERNGAPTAAFTASVAGLQASFDASATRDPEGDALRLDWDFGDGATGTGVRASHAYAAPGSYTVTLTASDGKAVSTASRTVTATRQNAAPAAAFTATSSGLTVQLDGSGSSDPDGDALAHSWSFGDGATASGAQASRTYAKAGTYTVTLTVSDGQASATRTQAVTVSAPAYAPTFKVGSGVNEWWVEVHVSPSAQKVEAQANGGTWVPLAKTNWGAWAKSFHVPKGSTVAFRATDASGQAATSAPVTWLAPTGTNPTPPAYAPTFQVSSSVNEWWVDVRVSPAAAKVEAQVNGGAWTPLAKTNWGSWAKSIHAPKGSDVAFRATDANGQAATSAPVTWMSGSQPGPTAPPPQPAFTATFTPKGTANNWWVEVKVQGSDAIVKVEARADGGAWTVLPKTDWGSYAKSFYVKDRAIVEFRATSDEGATAMSQKVTWV